VVLANDKECDWVSDEIYDDEAIIAQPGTEIRVTPDGVFVKKPSEGGN
jgi:hypothetical protein